MVLESARRRINDLESISKKLNQASDQFTEELKTIEAELNRLGLGIDVTLGRPLVEGGLEEDADEDGKIVERWRRNEYLGYGRNITGGWSILVRRYRDYIEDSRSYVGEIIDHDRSVLVEEQPLVTCTREIRIAAAERINDLLELLKTEAKGKLDTLNDRIDKK